MASGLSRGSGRARVFRGGVQSRAGASSRGAAAGASASSRNYKDDFTNEQKKRWGDFRSAAMGKRKSKRKPPPKRKNIEPLDTQFNCPFCNHEKTCEVKIDRERNVGRITCRVCMEEFQTPVTYLSEEVDVYSDWIDACEKANS